MTHENFQSPDHTNELYDRSLARCNRLIESGVWDIPRHRLKAWCNKFVSQEEQYLCALLLDALTYRSKEMVSSLCHHAIRSILPNNLNSYPNSITKWIECLERGTVKDFIFVAVEGINRSREREAAKSGQLVLREYHRSGAVNKRLFVDAEVLLNAIEKSKSISNVVFVDDFCGTGEQFETFYSHFQLNTLPNRISQTYIPLACHSGALKRFMNADLKNVKLCPVELLDEKHDFFIEIDGTFRGDALNSVTTAKSFYLEFLKKCDIQSKNPFGWGNLSVTHAFEFSTPNNMLPIFWSNMNNWPSLLDR